MKRSIASCALWLLAALALPVASCSAGVTAPAAQDFPIVVNVPSNATLILISSSERMEWRTEQVTFNWVDQLEVEGRSLGAEISARALDDTKAQQLYAGVPRVSELALAGSWTEAVLRWEDEMAETLRSALLHYRAEVRGGAGRSAAQSSTIALLRSSPLVEEATLMEEDLCVEEGGALRVQWLGWVEESLALTMEDPAPTSSTEIAYDVALAVARGLKGWLEGTPPQVTRTATLGHGSFILRQAERGK